MKQGQTTNNSISRINNEIAECDRSMKTVKKEYEKILSEIEVCPITMNPIKDECLKEAKKYG